jgi:hypothetical protein
VPDVAAPEAPEAYGRPHGSGFWAVAFAFLIVMAVATLPSPLYGLYRTRDHLSALTITVVFAIFAGSTIGVGTAGTPPCTSRRDLITTRRRDDMSIYFASVRVQEVAS